ncbi:segregation and condensation protein A [Rhodococcus sp. 27YEA15]|uniref:segregation and condensation protein A n=1 Tax=Rhodococcus sp. 27YEA15 TaxID=3156259 RepID=UPI003C7E20CA
MELIAPQEDSVLLEPEPRISNGKSDARAVTGFRVSLRNFEGPFDLLLNLINERRLDVTEVALHTVTDDFIEYTRELGVAMELDQTTQFLVVAATLLDLKAARLLPAGQIEDTEDLALLEARDLLFARLLQYRAYKQVASLFGELEEAALRRYPRSVSVEDQFAELLPEVLLGVDSQRFAEIAATVFTPPPVPTVALDHLHVSNVSIPEHADLVLALLRELGVGRWVSFGELVADCATTIDIVARFLALLELYRRQTIAFDQSDALGPLLVTLTTDEDTDRITEEVQL